MQPFKILTLKKLEKKAISLAEQMRQKDLVIIEEWHRFEDFTYRTYQFEVIHRETNSSWALTKLLIFPAFATRHEVKDFEVVPPYPVGSINRLITSIKVIETQKYGISTSLTRYEGLRSEKGRVTSEITYYQA